MRRRRTEAAASDLGGSPAAAAPSVLAAARAIDATQPVSEIRTLQQYFSQGALFGARIGWLVTASAGVVRTGSPNSRIGRTAMLCSPSTRQRDP